ncbi:MAG: NADH-quinone oxidoreductase subunit NuoG [Bryobacteraceae bacterium]|nr:NADH-quinone oxidoreductase subunit NuoG [Bryobacteraceae bacterium]
MATTTAPPSVINAKLNGQDIQTKPGTLLINLTKELGIEVPAFCYYEGFSLQAACRMCLVQVNNSPKLLPGCTTIVTEGMVIETESPLVVEARKSMLEFLLVNHPLDCPVCDKGGECELQDMVFKYGAGESRFVDIKHHEPERPFSPVVYYDPARCILCYRCVRVCDEGYGVNALGVVNRGVLSEIAPNLGDQLNCDECGACIDICPVGALTSHTYRYKTRPWEMKHVGTTCAHCSNGCKTTLGVRNDEIMRANNRDASGLNEEFLCIKGRFGFDFNHHAERLQSPLMRVDGELQPVSWSKALAAVASKFNAVKSAGGKFGVVGSNHTSNEENYYLQKFARQGLGTNHLDHARTGDVVTLVDALSGKNGKLAVMADLYQTKAALVIGSDLAQQHPLLAYELRRNFRHHQARVYAMTPGPVREDSYAVAKARVPFGEELAALESWREALAKEPELLILFGDSIKGDAVRRLVDFGESLGIPVKYVALVDYANSRGAIDMGLVPELLPGYAASGQPGMTLPEMLADPKLDVLWVVGADPLAGAKLAGKPFVVVQDLFLTATAAAADVVFPAASAYEKKGTVTNVTGELQRLNAAVKTMGTKPDLEILGLLGKEMGLDLGIWIADAVLEEIRRNVRGYNVTMPILASGGAALTSPVNGRVNVASRPELIRSAGDTLFTSGTLTKYSQVLNSVPERPGQLYKPV